MPSEARRGDVSGPVEGVSHCRKGDLEEINDLINYGTFQNCFDRSAGSTNNVQF